MGEQPFNHHHPWLGQLLKSNFKKYLCKRHGSILNNFCTDCLGLLICKKCTKCNEHRGHKVIRVFQSSRQDGIKVKDIKILLDISQIHHYVINGFGIVYIYQRLHSSKDKARLGGCSRARGSRKFCIRCGFELQSKIEVPDSKFCSIECKYETVCGRRDSLSPPQRIDETDTSDEMNNDEMDMVDEINHKKSLRRRPRKAHHPSRSPFF